MILEALCGVERRRYNLKAKLNAQYGSLYRVLHKVLHTIITIVTIRVPYLTLLFRLGAQELLAPRPTHNQFALPYILSKLSLYSHILPHRSHDR